MTTWPPPATRGRPPVSTRSAGGRGHRWCWPTASPRPVGCGGAWTTNSPVTTPWSRSTCPATDAPPWSPWTCGRVPPCSVRREAWATTSATRWAPASPCTWRSSGRTWCDGWSWCRAPPAWTARTSVPGAELLTRHWPIGCNRSTAAQRAELLVPGTGDHQDRHRELGEPVPQGCHGAGAGQTETRGEPGSRVGAALLEALCRGGNDAEQGSGHPPGDELVHRVGGRAAAERLQPIGQCLVNRSAPGTLVLAVQAGGARHQDQPSHHVRPLERQVQGEPGAHRVAEVVAHASRRTEQGGTRPQVHGDQCGASVAGQVDLDQGVVTGELVVQASPHPTGLGEAVGQHQRWTRTPAERVETGGRPRVAGGGRVAIGGRVAVSGWGHRRIRW